MSWLFDRYDAIDAALQKMLRFDQPSVLSYPPGAVEKFVYYVATVMIDVTLLGLFIYLIYRVLIGPGSPTSRPPSRWRWIGKLAGALVMAVVPLLVLEGAARAFVSTQPPGNYVPDPIYLWRFRPETDLAVPIPHKDASGHQTMSEMKIHTNALGLRDKDYPLSKDRREFRIVCLGDSATFSQGVEMDESYPRVLQRLLSKKYPDRTFTVINAGIPGYSILQGYYFFSEKLLEAYHPDLVIVNEFNQYSDRQLGEFVTNVPRGAFDRAVKKALWRSMLYLTARKEMGRFVQAQKSQGLDTPDSKEGIISADEMTYFVESFARLLGEQHIKGVFVLWRNPAIVLPFFTRGLSNAGQRGMVLDDYHDLVSPQNENKFWLADDPTHHPSAEGHRMMADKLFRTIVGNDMIPSRPEEVKP